MLDFKLESKHGLFGREFRAKGPPILVEHFYPRDLGSQPVQYRRDVATGEVFEQLPSTFVSEEVLLQRIPTYEVFCESAGKCYDHMVKSQYLLPGAEYWQYAVYVQQLKQAWASMQRMGGPHQLPIILRSFLVFERSCRLSQFASGVSWDRAFDGFGLMGVLAKLQLELKGAAAPGASAPAPAPSGGAGPSGGGKSGKSGGGKSGKGSGGGGGASGSGAASEAAGQFCYAFDRNGSCKEGAACRFVAGHSCLACGSASHGVYQCKAKAKPSAADAAGAQ
jgi:hypothetical protein